MSSRYRAVEIKGGYTVHFYYAPAGHFTTRVTHDGVFVAERPNCRSHISTARWVRSEIRRHRKAMRLLGDV